MKVLWFTGRIRKQNRTFYGGGGWIRALAAELAKCSDLELAMSYFCDEAIEPFDSKGVQQYPMCLKARGFIKKIVDNIGRKPEYCDEYLLQHMYSVINEYKPDIIQIFGTESMFTPLIGKTSIPTILYLQGMINPIANAFFPYGMNTYTLKFWRVDKREWIYNNGRIAREKQLKQMANNELLIYKKTKYMIGRTKFDYQVSRLFSPESKYFKVNEMMREPFYEGLLWERPLHYKYTIISTLSNVTYKGLDVIFKTASILSNKGIEYVWKIAGISINCDIVKLMQHLTKINIQSINIDFLGILGEEDLKKELLSANVMVHPSYIDNSPNSIGEAQLLGLPVIACYVGGVPDFIQNGETGELIPTNDPYDLAFILVKDINNPFLHMYSKPAYDVAIKRHNKSSIIGDLLSAYNEVLTDNCCDA